MLTFENIIIDYEKRVFNLLFYLCKNRQDAEDLTEETFIKVYKSFHKINQSQGITPYIYRIATNCYRNKKRFYNRVRRNVRTTSSLDEPVSIESEEIVQQIQDDQPNMLVHLEQKELCARVLAQVDKLKPKYKIPFMLSLQNFSHEEIAQIMRRSIVYVKVIICRTKKIIRKNLPNL
jgi:RNA polymerase sigma-70 factor (ECF subfamily)